MARARPHDFTRRLSYEWGPNLASRWRQFWVFVRNRHATVTFEGPVRIGPGFRLWIPESGTLSVGANAEFRCGFTAEISAGGRLAIGSGTIFTYDTLIQCSTSIEIGDRCVFGFGTNIADGNHRFRDVSRPLAEQGYDFREIHIGDDVAVMSKCTVIADIGTHSFIGANSVVTRDIPPYSLAVGAPARIVEEMGPPERKTRTRRGHA